MFKVNGTLEGLDEALIAELDLAVKDALETGMKRAAETARSTHAFQNRTGNLEGSIHDITPTGSFSAGNIEAGIEATADYASYVIANTGDDFLAAALDAEGPSIEDDVSDAIERVAGKQHSGG